MVTKRKKASSLNTRTALKRALANSEQVTAALVDALTEVEVGDGTELAVAVGALRNIAGQRDNATAAEMRGTARAALGKLNLRRTS